MIEGVEFFQEHLGNAVASNNLEGMVETFQKMTESEKEVINKLFCSIENITLNGYIKRGELDSIIDAFVFYVEENSIDYNNVKTVCLCEVGFKKHCYFIMEDDSIISTEEFDLLNSKLLLSKEVFEIKNSLEEDKILSDFIYQEYYNFVDKYIS